MTRQARLVRVLLPAAAALLFALSPGRIAVEHLSEYPIEFIASPNCDQRPSPEISAVVIHATVLPTLEAVVRHFLDPRSRVSAHYVVDRNGRIVQMVRVEERAWHAGVSELDGIAHVNDFSVGIELVNLNDGADPYPERQIEATAALVRKLRERHPITLQRIVAHAEVARPPGRKNDPAGLDLGRIRRLCGGE